MKKELEILTPVSPWQNFAQEYFALRQKEWRLPDDALLALLPFVEKNHPHAKAWKTRKSGLQKLLGALKKDWPKGAHILDIGCGNGWMSNRMAEAGFDVMAIDVNLPELEQAHRVFNRPNLRFAFADLFVWQPEIPFDAVVLSSAIQYFENPKALLQHLFATNKNLRVVYICESPFYTSKNKIEAAMRSQEYYKKLGYESMAAHYHHHTLQDLGFTFQVIFQPKPAFLRRLIGGVAFPLIAVLRTS